MHSERVRYVLVPGWYGSEDAHWQSHWQRALPNASRVEQQDWITPLRADWIAELDAEIRRQPGPVVLIAHSLGCVTVALWAAQAERRVRDQVRGALLVAPADVERERNNSKYLAANRRVPHLACPSLRQRGASAGPRPARRRHS